MSNLATLQPKANDPSLDLSLRQFWKISARTRMLYDGRSASKSWDAAGVAMLFVCRSKARIPCARQFRNRMEESIYVLIMYQIYEFGLCDQFIIHRDRITFF